MICYSLITQPDAAPPRPSLSSWNLISGTREIRLRVPVYAPRLRSQNRPLPPNPQGTFLAPHGGAGTGGQAGSRNPIAIPRAAAGVRTRCPCRRRQQGAAAVGAARRGDQPPALRLPRVGVPPPPLPLGFPHHLPHQCVPSSVLEICFRFEASGDGFVGGFMSFEVISYA